MSRPLNRCFQGFLLALLFFCGFQTAGAKLRLPAIISDHMALQSGRPTTLWGWADAGEKVTVTFLDSEGKSLANGTASANDEGKWTVRLPALASGAAGKIEIACGPEERRVIQDVIVGEVWLAAGQSNMDFVLKSSSTAEKALASASQPEIRLFKVKHSAPKAAADDVQGKWVPADPNSATSFSAVAWHFGFALHRELQAPVGMIAAAWGGTPIEAWLPPAAMSQFPKAARYLEAAYARGVSSYPARLADYEKNLSAWKAANPSEAAAASKPPKAPPVPNEKNLPSHCYNGMISGLVPYALQGAIWYQGEANGSRPAEYAKLFPELVKSWRGVFENPDLSFFYVELANMENPPTVESIPGGWAWIREAQASILSMPNTGMATAIDVGDPRDIHPKDKETVGDRLAKQALEKTYRKPGVLSSPRYRSHEIEKGKIRVHFDNAEGLYTKTNPIPGFVVRGQNGQWLKAEARIEGTDILVWNETVPNPEAVRYAWESNPTITVRNKTDLPLLPFRTDSEPMPQASAAPRPPA